ncbi:oxidoreductase [Corynebacterium halotolerans YIM 70093 = DSM 44683]|uniref:Oxidoreductase n=2 Tax=Corynebacterium halotolerans TaxID=225326 RepID=M1NP31_9CORY|nr:oxidoreductase [Corynebacterium halotolerans YIM 70093 = DSM 44683]
MDTIRFDRLDPSVYARQARTGLRTDMTTRAAYTSDASIFRRVPAAVLEPRSVEDIRDGLMIAREKGWPIVGRGGGSSVAGNAIGEGLVIDTSRHFNRILDLDPVARTATVEPGVVCDALRDAAAVHGLTYGPDPSTHSRCTIGGMVSNNACGSHSIVHGTAADNLVDVTLMLADGREVTVGPEGCDDPEIDAQLRRLAEADDCLLRSELGRFPRQASGYGLHHLLDNPAKAIAGTEGTVGVITRLTVNLVAKPRATALAVLAFGSIFDAAAAAAALRRVDLPGLATVEGMGGDLIDALRNRPGQKNAGDNLPGTDRDADGWLYCETGGATPEEAAERAAAVTEAAAVDTLAAQVYTDADEMRGLWRIREASAGIVTRLPDGGEAWPSWEDAAVPPEHLADYLRDFDALLDRHHLHGIPYGHFGEGCVHVRISFDFHSEEGVAVFREFMADAARLVVSYDGSLSGEHGDGRARSALLREMYSSALRDAFEKFKLIFDPDRVFNPGVLVWADALTDGLRPGPAQRTFEITPVHSFPHDRGSFLNAVNRCVGVAACRSEEGAMCPSFQITGDEVHSTRGRARVLSEMFRGESLPEGFRAPEVEEALDLCLSCKACAAECPVTVDMATYKAEFLQEHYRGRLRPRSHYLLGWLPLLGHLAHTLPGVPRLADAALRTPGLSGLMKRLGGLDRKRPLIRFAHTSLRKWHRKRTGGRSAGTDGADGADGDWETVVLWPDTFTSSLDTGPGRAAVEVLEALGYRVEIPDAFVCCGLTWHSTGQLGMTKKVLERTAKVMKPYLDRGLTVVGLEPSCTVMLSTEVTALSDHPDLARLAAAVKPWAEVVAPRLRALVEKGEVDAAGPATATALTQVHCHERSLGDPGAASALLDALGIDEEQIATGCCGLAGNWGFEDGHAEMSLALGERELFPKVRAAEGEVIADGFSCRTQIGQGTGERAKHLAEVVHDLLADRGVAE